MENRYVQAYVQQCHVCSIHHTGPCQLQGHLQQALACDVMQKVHVYCVRPFPLVKKGHQYLLTQFAVLQNTSSVSLSGIERTTLWWMLS